MDGRVFVFKPIRERAASLAVASLLRLLGERGQRSGPGWRLLEAGDDITNGVLLIPDITEDCRKKDLERVFSKYGPLKEIWLATYAPFYAFINYESKSDMEVLYEICFT